MMATARVVDNILQAFERVRKRPDCDQYSTTGRAELQSRISALVSCGQEIVFLLPAFAMKCNSPEKVIEPGVADRAEQACLDNLGYFVEEVAACYERVRLVIASDWRVYGDLLGTTAEAGCDYNKQVRAMTLAFPHLQWASLEDLHGEEGYSNTLPSWFEAEYGQDLASVANLIETDENRRRVHKLFSRFVREEAGPMTEDALHARAMQMMVRHDAYNALLSRFAPGHIRLSIHTTANKDK